MTELLNFKIEKMAIGDYEEIHRIWSNESGITLRSIDDSRKGIELFLQRNPDTNFVCRSDKEIVGGILCGHDGRKGFIYHLAVKEVHRKKGVGKKLVSYAIQSLKNEGITKIGVLVNHDNLSGNIFWQALGFDHLDDLKYRILSINDLNQ